MSQFNKHIIIVGSARSGTSWLSELIARQFRYRMLFEPEHEFNTKKGKIICDRWIESKEENPEAHAYLKKVFKNRVDSDWIAQISNRKYKMHLWPLIPKKYIIKFVRANLAAKYINEAFKIPVIHIIRNPYDVITSQQRVRFPWLFNLDYFKKQDKLVELINTKYGYNLLTLSDLSSVETLALRWCIENTVVLNNAIPYKNKHRIIKYEDLRDNVQLFLNICDEFNIEPLPNIKNEYARPSSKTHPKSTIVDQNAKVKEMSPEDLLKVNTIMDIFKCNLYPRKE